jgi:hypothetical protein
MKEIGMYSLEAVVNFHSYDTHIRADRTYIEGKLGLREVLRIMDKLSKSEKGALSKQLYPYYQKVAASRLMPDLKKVYKEVRYVDISNKNDRHSHWSHVYIHIGKKEYFGSWDNGIEALEDIGKDHLKRCIAILADKGYITISNTKKNRRMSGYNYTYSNTYYKLTEKAEALLEKMAQGK